MRLYELQANQVDQELDNIAKKAGTSGTGEKTVDDLEPGAGSSEENPDDPNAMGADPMMGGGDMGMGGGMGGDMGMGGEGGPAGDPVQNPDQEANQQEWNDTLKKNIDQFLITSMQANPYVRNWKHEQGSKTNPMAILAMSNSELSELKTVARNMIANLTMTDQIGTYEDPQMKYLTQLYSFVEKTIQLKNEKAAQSKPQSERQAGSSKKSWNPATKPGKHKDYKSFVAKR